MSNSRMKYDEEFKKRAVRMSYSSEHSVTAVADSFGGNQQHDLSLAKKIHTGTQTDMKQMVSYGWQQSFTAVGKPGDNAWSERFFSILKKEIVHWRFYPIREAARQA